MTVKVKHVSHMIKFVTIRDYWVSVKRHTVGCDFVASIEKFVD